MIYGAYLVHISTPSSGYEISQVRSCPMQYLFCLVVVVAKLDIKPKSYNEYYSGIEAVLKL